jgi:hypothetical protein
MRPDPQAPLCGCTHQLDRSSGVTLHLSPASEGAQIFTSSVMEVNVHTAPRKPGGPPVRLRPPPPHTQRERETEVLPLCAHNTTDDGD